MAEINWYNNNKEMYIYNIYNINIYIYIYIYIYSPATINSGELFLPLNYSKKTLSVID